MLTTPAIIRSEIVEALKLDLVGPDNIHAVAHELLPDAPSRWYMCGFLVPSSAPMEQKSDETSADEIDSGDDTKGADDAAPPDRATTYDFILARLLRLTAERAEQEKLSGEAAAAAKPKKPRGKTTSVASPAQSDLIPPPQKDLFAG